MATKTKSKSTTKKSKSTSKSTGGSRVQSKVSAQDNARDTTRKKLGKYDTFSRLEGQSCKAKDPEDNEIKEGTVIELNEYDENGTPHTAVFQPRNAAYRFVVDPKDVELIDGDGFERGV